MHFLFVILAFLLFCQTLTHVSSQRIQGRYIRPNQPKCDRQGGCPQGDEPSDEPDFKDYKSDDDRRRPVVREHPGRDKDFKQGVVVEPKPVRVNYDYKPVEEDRRDHDAKLPEPSLVKHDSTGDSYSSGGGYNRQPVRGSNGGYNPRPYVDTPDQDTYKPKPVEIGAGYNPNLHPDTDGYVSKPLDEGYRPLPTHDETYYVSKPIPGVGFRPKPEKPITRPIPGSDYPKQDDFSRPLYPNKELGGINEPKDDDYNNEPGVGGNLKDKDYVGEVKPIPMIEGGNCICVPYYQCQEGHIVTDGAGIIDARKRPEPEEELPLDGKFKPPTCGPFHVCCNTPETSTVKPYEHRCGVRNPSGINSRILSPSNKGEADFGEWPWQAAVLKAEGKVNIFQCGGVLIDKFHVLTVAHCVFHLHKYNEYPLKVRLGEWDTQTTTEFLAHEDYKVAKIIVHPEYKNTSLWNDVAILRLEEAVLFAPHIDTICLPKYDEIFSEQNCVITGWGKDAYKGGTFSNIMKEVALQVIDNYKCEEMLRKTRLGRFFQLHEGFLCAGGEYGLDSCKGDGGGPLVCYRKDKSYALAGIVSWGIDCGQPGVPGVYVKIQKYLDWISKSTGVNLQDYWPKQ